MRIVMANPTRLPDAAADIPRAYPMLYYIYLTASGYTAVSPSGFTLQATPNFTITRRLLPLPPR